jgi:hypothetical protein
LKKAEDNRKRKQGESTQDIHDVIIQISVARGRPYEANTRGDRGPILEAYLRGHEGIGEKRQGMSQVAECLPSKCEVLSSIPSTMKLKKERPKARSSTLQLKCTSLETTRMFGPL